MHAILYVPDMDITLLSVVNFSKELGHRPGNEPSKSIIGSRSCHGVCFPCSCLSKGHYSGIVAIKDWRDEATATMMIDCFLTSIVQYLQDNVSSMI